jgi:hypothetical protein
MSNKFKKNLIEFIDEICQFNDAFKNRRPNSAKKISAKITTDLIYKPVKYLLVSINFFNFK